MNVLPARDDAGTKNGSTDRGDGDRRCPRRAVIDRSSEFEREAPSTCRRGHVFDGRNQIDRISLSKEPPIHRGEVACRRSDDVRRSPSHSIVCGASVHQLTVEVPDDVDLVADGQTADVIDQ